MQEYHVGGMHADVLAAWRWAGAALADALGAELVSVSLPHAAHAPRCYLVLTCAEIASNMARYRKEPRFLCLYL